MGAESSSTDSDDDPMILFSQMKSSKRKKKSPTMTKNSTSTPKRSKLCSRKPSASPSQRHTKTASIFDVSSPRKSCDSSATRTRTPSRPSQGSVSNLTKIKETTAEAETPKYCANCQMPFELLLAWESPSLHASNCIETDFSKLPDCPDGVTCDCTIKSHFSKFNHFKLASFRDNSDQDTFETPPEDLEKPVESVIEVEKVPNTADAESHGNNEEVNKSTDDMFEDNDVFVEAADKVDEVNLDTIDGTPAKSQGVTVIPTRDEDGGIEIEVKMTPDVVITEKMKFKIPAPKSPDADNMLFTAKIKKHQSTLDSFFGTSNQSSTSTRISDSTGSLKEEAARRGFKVLENLGAKPSVSNKNVKNYSRSSSNNDNTGGAFGYRGPRTCPFYKKLPGTTFAVDAFNYGSVPGISHYFLSHFHYDHYGGMTKQWSEPVICSAITARMIALKIKVDQKFVRIMKLNKPEVIEGVEVTLLDANHCPGSVMFLFKLPNNGQVYLHTGDFRACPEMEEYPELWNCKVDKLYLDTTYLKPEYDFPSQSSVIDAAVKLVKKHLIQHPETLICVGSYTIGKERIFVAIADAIQANIWANTEKTRVLRTLDIPMISSKLVATSFLAKVHVLDMRTVKRKDLSAEHLKIHSNRFDKILSIVPTGWTHDGSDPGASSLSGMKIKSLGMDVFQLNVPYSEHSSFSELKRFVRFLKLDSAEKILATVNVGNPASRNAQKAFFKTWIQEANQPKLSSFYQNNNSAS